MDEDEGEDILDDAGGRKVRLFFGQADLVQRLVDPPKEDELRPQLSRRYIQQEVEDPEPRRRWGDADAGRGAPVRQRTSWGIDVRAGRQRQHIRHRRQRRRGRRSPADHRAGPVGQSVARAFASRHCPGDLPVAAGVEHPRPGCIRSCLPDDFSRAPFPQELEISPHPAMAKLEGKRCASAVAQKFSTPGGVVPGHQGRCCWPGAGTPTGAFPPPSAPV